MTVYLTDSEFKSYGLCADLTRATASTMEAAGIMAELFGRLFDGRLKYRRTGIVLNRLEADKEIQYDLFEDRCKVKALRQISAVVDEVNALYGKHALHLGASDCLRQFNQHLGDRGDIAPRKLNCLKGETFRRHLRVPVWNVKLN